MIGECAHPESELRRYRNAKGASIYEGTREVHTLMQADYVLGYREDKERPFGLPPWPFDS